MSLLRKAFLSQKLIPVSDERRDGRSSGSRVNTSSLLPDCFDTLVSVASQCQWFMQVALRLQLRVQPQIDSRVISISPPHRVPFMPNGHRRRGLSGSEASDASQSQKINAEQHQKSMPCFARIPDWKGCFTSFISVTRSATSMSSSLASRPVRITLVRECRLSTAAITSCTSR